MASSGLSGLQPARLDARRLPRGLNCPFTRLSNYAQAEENRLSVSNVFSTEMGCLEPTGILEQETAYLTALSAAATYQITADRLEMFDETGDQVLVFVVQ